MYAKLQALLAMICRTVNIPVNIIYPADYPDRPAILLEERILVADAIEALDRISNR